LISAALFSPDSLAVGDPKEWRRRVFVWVEADSVMHSWYPLAEVLEVFAGESEPDLFRWFDGFEWLVDPAGRLLVARPGVADTLRNMIAQCAVGTSVTEAASAAAAPVVVSGLTKRLGRGAG